jgi:ubiquinone/menaquinone biosynthesis C-methylase UbiE
LDFGCGVGRLTQALSRYYDHVWGVDIAPSMLELAASCNLHGKTCTYVLNVRDDLNLFPDDEFDLVYSKITLQHIQPACSAKYIREFLRITAPGGLAVFQIPSRPLSAEPLALEANTAGVPGLDETAPTMGIFGIDREAVVQLVRDYGATMVDIRKDQSAGPQWESFHYCAMKQA